jgi:hypothetical protein
MKRSIVIGLGLLAVVAAVLPVIAVLADAPPAPPAVYYGTATGAVSGQSVFAIVSDGTNSALCGKGIVLSDSTAGIVYVIDVIGDSQKAGCGASGRTIQFYFSPTGGAGGRLATGSTGWQGAGGYANNLTLGTPLSLKQSVPAVSRD